MRFGFELELLAPPGSTRRDVAIAIAGAHGGTVSPRFHLDAEPSKAAGVDLFHHLTPAFAVHDGAGHLVCTVVDDVTIQADLDAAAGPAAGWYRIVSDDRRLLRLVERQCDPAAPIDACLEPIARLFGTPPRRHGDFVRVDDEGGGTVAIAAPLPGERHRPCELITPPIDDDHGSRLEALLAPARALGCTLPAEAAVHVHADADLVRDGRVLRNLVRLVAPYAEVLRWLVATNPRCRRLGPLPEALIDAVEAPGFAELPWTDARARLLDVGLTKYSDLNLRNAVFPPPGKETVEWRVLPGSLDAAPVVEGARLFGAVVARAAAAPPPARLHGVVPPGLDGARQLLDELGCPHELGRWLGRQTVDVEL